VVVVMLVVDITPLPYMCSSPLDGGGSS
jgi:hypothetical protein